MRRPLLAAVTAVALLVAACGGDDDAGSGGTTGGVTVTDAWARATPPGVSIGAVYLTASSATADELVGADVDASVAASVQAHSTDDTGGMTSMEELPSLPIPAGGELTLAPLGDHLMLVDLTGPLVTGTTFDVTLHFAAAGDQGVAVEVREDAP